MAAALSATTGCSVLTTQPPVSRRTEFWGFTAPWDPRSGRSVAAHGGSLGAVVSGWIVLDSATFQPRAPYADSAVQQVTSAGASAMALVTTYQGTRFHPETVRGLASDPVALGRTAGATAALAGAAGYRGMVLDLEGSTAADLAALLSVTAAMRDSAHAHGIPTVALAIPATDTAGYPTRLLAAAADLLVVMLYDQHWARSTPGAIAAPVWARRALATRLGEVGPGRVVAAFPVYGYRWRRDSAAAVVSYDDAVQAAASAGAPLVRDPASATLRAVAPALGWEIWVSDAVLLDTLVRDAHAAGVTRFALWRLGLEDERVWTTVVAGRR